MAERRGGTKGRRMGSSRRKQLREGSSEAPTAAPSPGEEPPRAAEIVQRVQDFFKEQDKDQAGFVTRSDMKKLQEEDFPCSTEELELVFDGLDAAGTGRLRTEEFTAGLYQFMSSQKAARDHRRRKTASRRVRLVLPSPAEEGADSEERRHFAAFMEQLGTDNISEEKEIWQLWVTLRQDNPQLLGNLEDFLAKMRHRIQEARSKKAALEVTLNKRVAEHDKEVQQLCEAMEQQIQQEKQRLEHESMARSHQHSEELRRALDASEREVQRLVRAQMELETRCRSLHSTQQATSTENRQLEESNHELEDRLQHLHQQLQETQGCLQRLRAAVVWEHTEESRDRAVAELPGETPVSPQTSLVTSEKHHSKMQIGLWSQSGEPKAKRTHQVVWEMPPAEISHLGALQRVSSTEEDSFSEFLKEERFSDQSSLLREMNDAIAALSKQLKPQAPGAPPVPADAAPHSRDDAESQAGLEAASASSLLQETLLGHIGHEVFQGDLTEGPATAQLGAPDVTEAGASVGAGHHGVQELGAEQGESPDEAWRMLFLQGKGTGVKELVLKAAEHPQGTPGESTEAGELVEVEGVGGMQEKTGWEKAWPLGEAEEVALSQGENQETGLGPPEAGEAGLAAGWQLGPAAALEEGTEPWSTGLEEEAGEPLGRTEELEIQPGEHLEPEPPSWGQADGSPAEVTGNPGSGMLAEECVHVEVQPWGETLDANVPPARHGGSSRAGAGKGEVEVRQPTEAEPQGESVTDATMWGGREGGEELLPVAVPPGGTGTDVQLLEAQSSDANMQLLAEVDADLQPPSEWGSLGPEQGGSGAPGVQPLEEVNKAELGVGEEPSAATVHGEGPSPAETPAEVADVGGLLPVKAQALELVRAEESWAHTQLREDPSPEAPQGSGDYAAMQLGGEDEDGGQGQGEHEMPHEPLMQHHGAGFRQESGAGAEEQPGNEGDKHSAGRGDPAPLPTVPCRGQRPGVEKSGGVHYSEEAWDLGLVQGEGINKDGLLLVKAQALELVEAAESWVDVQLRGGLSPETPSWEGEGPAAVELMEKAEEGAHRQGEHEVPCELDPRGAEARQGEGAGAGVQPWEEAAILDTLEDQSSDANMQLFAEAVELELTPGGSTETDLQPLSEAGYLGREQGMSVAPDVQIQGQADKLELMEMEAEDAQADTELGWGLSSEVPRGGEGGAAMQLTEEAEDGAHGQSECELPHELDPQGGGVGEGAGAGVQSQEEAVILDRLEDQSSDANMQLLAEAVELELTPGQSMEADLQPLSNAGSLDTEQGMSVAPDVQLHGEVEAEDLHADTQLCGVVSLETLQGGEGGADVELLEEAEDGVQGQDKHGLPQEPVLHPHGVAIAQGEGASEDVQPWEEAVILDTLEDQSTEAHVQLRAEVDELKLTPGCRTEADLQPLSQVGSLDTKQGGCGYVAPDVQLQSQVDKPETVELVEAEVSWVDTQLHGVASPEILQGWRLCAAVHLLEEAEDGAQGKGECELPQEPVLDPQGAGVRQGEGAGAGGQPWEEAVILDTPADQSSDAHMQPHSEVYELKTAPGGGMEADPGTLSEAGSMDTEQGRAVAPGVQPLDQVNEPESVEMEAENSWVDVQLRGGLSPETFQGPGSPSAVELVEEAEEGAQGQGEFELPQSTLQPQRTRAVKGEGAGAGVQLWEEAAIVDTLDNQSSDANMQPLIEMEALKSILGGSTEADLAILDAAGMQEGEQSQAPGPEAGLCAAHSSDTLEGPAGAHVSSPAEATFYPERAAAPEGPGLEAKLGAPTGPDGHILGDSQTLELQLGERAAAERRPLDGAQGLEVVQGERLEAGVRSLLETYGLGIKQGHDDAASALAPPVSEVSLQTSTLKLETMMQEDVLIPDVRRLGPSAQAVQSELQEQVSAQADKVRLGIASQQPEEKPPHVMETELVAARPSEPPKQEVPPASTLHTEVQREEDAGNDQLGMVLGDSSLGDAANSSRQHQRQLSGEHSKDLSARQMEKKQEVQRKLSQEGEPSSGAVTADGAGAAPRGSPEAPLEPDHLYNVLFVGDSHVGKTSFLYRLHADTFNPHLTATVGLDYQIKNLVVDNKRFALRLWDSAGQERYHSITKQFFRKADGVVLMYDITSEHSFADVRYWLSCIQEGAEDGVAILLLGNKTDCAAERQVPTKEGERLAKEHQLMFYECSAASGHNVSESMVSLIRLLKVHEDELKKKAQEVSKPPQKKKGCCW